MAELTAEKPASVDETTAASKDLYGAEEAGRVSRPQGWKYRSFRIGRICIPWYASPPFQLVLVALVCFLCPGMFNAVNGLGGGGQISATVANNANVCSFVPKLLLGKTRKC